MNPLRYFLPLAFLVSFICSIFFYETAKAWLSVSMFGLMAAGIFFYSPKYVLQRFVADKALLILSFSAMSLLFYLLLSDNINYAWNRIEIKAPLLGLSIAFAAIGKVERKHYLLLLLAYVLISLSTACYTIFNYLLNYEEVTESYLRAQVMPTIINHVRYSIMIAMGCYVSYYLYRDKYEFGIIKSNTFLVIACLLFVFLHVYSVRSGLVAIYGMLAMEMVYWVKETKNYKGFVLSGAAGILILISSISFVPTLRNKWVNTVADMQIYIQKGHPNYNSLTTRFISYEGAFSIAKKEPLLGCGLGDIKDETDLFFKTQYPMIDIPILPHNQFLFYLAATGIVGLFVFCFTFYFPLFYKRNWKNRILLMQYMVLTLSFMTEPMLETQLGMAYSVLFIFLPLTQREENQI